MKLHRITLHNFMPYRDTSSVEFPAVDGRGVVVIYGDNMRGKTSFLNAIRWAFFGKATARHMRHVARMDLVNADAAAAGDWTVWVELDFQAGDDRFTLRRTMERARHVAHPESDAHFVETRTLSKNGNPLDPEGSDDELNQILPEEISRFFLFDGELLQEYETLVRDTNQGPRIKQAIERVLGVPALIKGRDELRALLSQAQTSQAQDLRHLKSLRSQAEQQLRLQREISEIQATISARREAKDATQREIDEIDLELERRAIQSERMAEYDELRGRRNQLEGQLATQKERRAHLLQDAWRDLLEPQLKLRVSQLESDQQQILASMSGRASIAKEAEFLEQAYSGEKCPICEQSVPNASKKRLATRLGAVEGAVRAATVDVQRLAIVSSQLEALRRIRGFSVTEAIADAEREMSNLSVALATAEGELNDLEEQLDPKTQLEVDRLTGRRIPLHLSVAQKDQEIAELQWDLEEKSKKLAQIARLLARNPEARRQRSSSLVEKFGALERVFAASVDKLRQRQREKVGAIAGEAFSRMTTESEFKNLAINENYGLTIIDEKGREVAERSAGAEQIVALSLIDGLNKVARRSDPIVMDTPFGRLDNRHRQKVLEYLPAMAEQVVLLVHEGEMDPERDLPIIQHKVSAMYRIERLSARHSKLTPMDLA